MTNTNRRRYRWSLRHRLRARRVAQYTGWQPGELAALMESDTRRETEARLARAMHHVVLRGRLAETALEPWQRHVILAAHLHSGVIFAAPRQHES